MKQTEWYLHRCFIVLLLYYTSTFLNASSNDDDNLNSYIRSVVGFTAIGKSSSVVNKKYLRLIKSVAVASTTLIFVTEHFRGISTIVDREPLSLRVFVLRDRLCEY